MIQEEFEYFKETYNSLLPEMEEEPQQIFKIEIELRENVAG